MFKSPMNYTGNKYKLLPQILPLFPQNVDKFVDLFCGGLDISLNIQAKEKYCNDLEPHIIEFYTQLPKYTGIEVDNLIKTYVDKYQLTITNTEGYNLFRKDYNSKILYDQWLGIYILLAHSFSHQIRFNRQNEFNMPFGKNRSCYNPTLQKRLIEFVDRIDNTYHFSNMDFETFDFSILDENSFVYCDPPYLITTASYNENGGWSEEKEIQLLNLLDELNARNIKFGLSNVMSQGTKTNYLLFEWSNKYTIHHLSYQYNNCNYHKKDKEQDTDEVFICNY